METGLSLHRQAMAVLDAVIFNKDKMIRKDPVKIKQANLEAYKLERQAAETIECKNENEPTRSVLYRSAGWMAHNAELYKEGIEMAVAGLEGAVHGDMIHELRDLKTACEKEIGKINS